VNLIWFRIQIVQASEPDIQNLIEESSLANRRIEWLVWMLSLSTPGIRDIPAR
jgi:hypothetical protein